MKIKPLFLLFLCFGLLKTIPSLSQPNPGYKLPDSYKFDYTVTQTVRHEKKVPDSSIIHFFYTQSGEYAGVEMGRNADSRGNLFIILNREGNSIIFDEHHKSITVISIRKLASDLAGLTKWIRMDSVMAYMRRRKDGKEITSVKTGNHKQVGNYTTEEYLVTDSRGRKGSVWCAKMDFDTQGDYLMGAIGGNFIKMMSSNMGSHPLLQTLTQPRALITEIQFMDSTGARRMEMQTESIEQLSKTVSTAGYSLSDYSNMTLPEIFQAEMKKRNH
ncbi:MAG TPA: hypothetical protein VFI33_08755 [Puia sp.]|nr:hypothetical protein [Puia sp.]